MIVLESVVRKYLEAKPLSILLELVVTLMPIAAGHDLVQVLLIVALLTAPLITPAIALGTT